MQLNTSNRAAIMQDVDSLQRDLKRKDDLIQEHTAKLVAWKQQLHELQLEQNVYLKVWARDCVVMSMIAFIGRRVSPRQELLVTAPTEISSKVVAGGAALLNLFPRLHLPTHFLFLQCRSLSWTLRRPMLERIWTTQMTLWNRM